MEDWNAEYETRCERRTQLSTTADKLTEELTQAFSTEKWALFTENQKEKNALDEEISGMLAEKAVEVENANKNATKLMEEAKKIEENAAQLNKLTRDTIDWHQNEQRSTNPSSETTIGPGRDHEQLVTPVDDASLRSQVERDQTGLDETPGNQRWYDARSSTQNRSGRQEPSFQQSLQQSMQLAIEASSSSISKSLLTVEKCVPTEGNVIRLSDWVRWKEMLLLSVSAVMGLSEKEKHLVLMKSAGPQLLDVLDEQLLDVSSSSKPFQETVGKLDAYFTSDTVVREARGRFKRMDQREEETNVEYLARLFRFAKNCRYQETTFNESFMETVARCALDPDIRKEAMTFDRTTDERCTYKQLRNFAIQLDASRRLESELAGARSRHDGQFSASKQTVFAVTSGGNDRGGYTQRADRGWTNGRNPSNASGRSSGGWSAPTRLLIDCSVCGSFYHRTAKCFHAHKTCDNCNKVGHLKAKCSARSPNRKRRGSPVMMMPGGKSAKREVSAIDEPSADEKVQSE